MVWLFYVYSYLEFIWGSFSIRTFSTRGKCYWEGGCGCVCVLMGGGALYAGRDFGLLLFPLASLLMCSQHLRNIQFHLKPASCDDKSISQYYPTGRCKKKNEYHEKGQYFWSLISESETHIIYKLFTHRVKYSKPLFHEILRIMAYR